MNDLEAEQIILQVFREHPHNVLYKLDIQDLTSVKKTMGDRVLARLAREGKLKKSTLAMHDRGQRGYGYAYHLPDADVTRLVPLDMWGNETLWPDETVKADQVLHAIFRQVL